MSYSPNAPLYDNIGLNYDATRQADPYLTKRLAHHLRLEGPLHYLDIASGTGNYTTALAEPGRSLARSGPLPGDDPVRQPQEPPDPLFSG